MTMHLVLSAFTSRQFSSLLSTKASVLYSRYRFNKNIKIIIHQKPACPVEFQTFWSAWTLLMAQLIRCHSGFSVQFLEFTNKVHLCFSLATTAHYRLSGSRRKGENSLILFQNRPGNPKQTKPRRRRAPNCKAGIIYVNQFSLTTVKIKNRLRSSTTGGVT